MFKLKRMKTRTLIVIMATSLTAFVACKQGENGGTESTEGSLELKTEMDSVSYALGINLGSNVNKSGMTEINGAALGAAAELSAKGDSAKFTPVEAGEILNAYFGKLQKVKADSDSQVGRDWLAENAKKEGVVSTPSGLQYKVIESGSGATPGPTSQVTVHYHGTLIDGKVFDSSMDRGQPIPLAVNGVIPGWTEALQMMKEGDLWELYIPYNLGYREQGSGPIPGYATLIFKVQLISVDS